MLEIGIWVTVQTPEIPAKLQILFYERLFGIFFVLYAVFCV